MKILGIIASVTILAAGSAEASGPGLAPSDPVIHPVPRGGFHWAGMYAGGSIGFGSSNYALSLSVSRLPDGPLPAAEDPFLYVRLPDLGGMGPIGAAQIGYNFVLSDRVVLGVQADTTMSRIVNRTSIDYLGLGFDYTLGPRTMHTIAGRLGYLTTPDTMVYGLLGATRGNFRGRGTLSFDGPTPSDSVDVFSYDFRLNGMSVGMGMETRLTERVTLGLEYRYTRFNRYNFIDVPEVNFGFNTTVQTIRTSLNYHF
jgi:outer membrane immunogenic protein